MFLSICISLSTFKSNPDDVITIVVVVVVIKAIFLIMILEMHSYRQQERDVAGVERPLVLRYFVRSISRVGAIELLLVPGGAPRLV